MTRVLLAATFALASTCTFAGGYRHGGGWHHGHKHYKSSVHLGINFGAPLYQPWSWYYYPPPVYYYPTYYPPAPVYVPPPAPPAYVERGDVEGERSGTWYFCRESNSYYPYAKHCPGGWTRVPAQPPNGAR